MLKQVYQAGKGASMVGINIRRIDAANRTFPWRYKMEWLLNPPEVLWDRGLWSAAPGQVNQRVVSEHLSLANGEIWYCPALA